MTDDQTSADVAADRRHAIELAVEMRPDMELDELAQVLERLGFATDDATLESDLDALGYDVVVEDVDGVEDDGDDVHAADVDGAEAGTADAGVPEAPPEAGGPADSDDEALAALAASSQATDAELDATGAADDSEAWDPSEQDTAPPDPVPPVVAAPSDGGVDPSAGGDDGGEVDRPAATATGARPDRVTRVIAAVAIVAAIVCVASLVWLFADRSSDDPEGADGPTTTEQPRSTATSGPTTTTEPTPSTVPPLTDPVEEMDFSVPSELLPATVAGESWRPVAGDFAVADGVAVSDPGVQVSVAVIPTPPGDMRAEVTLPEPSDRAGLAFSVRDDDSYRAWVIDTAASTATLYLVEGTGREVEVAPVEVPLAPGVVLGVSIEGDTTSLIVDGSVVATVPTRDGTGVGLAALAPLTAATFDDLRVAHG